MTTQTSLSLAFSPRTVFVSTEFIRAVRGVDADAVYNAVDRGEFRWVFDLSDQHAGKRDLRFWARELIAPEATRALTLNQAVTSILADDRPVWDGAEIQQLLMVSRPTFKHFRDRGVLPGKVAKGRSKVKRPALAQFLKAHWVQPAVKEKAIA